MVNHVKDLQEFMDFDSSESVVSVPGRQTNFPSSSEMRRLRCFSNREFTWSVWKIFDDESTIPCLTQQDQHSTNSRLSAGNG